MVSTPQFLLKLTKASKRKDKAASASAQRDAGEPDVTQPDFWEDGVSPINDKDESQHPVAHDFEQVCSVQVQLESLASIPSRSLTADFKSVYSEEDTCPSPCKLEVTASFYQKEYFSETW